jgi:hypothetical protein
MSTLGRSTSPSRPKYLGVRWRAARDGHHAVPGLDRLDGERPDAGPVPVPHRPQLLVGHSLASADLRRGTASLLASLPGAAGGVRTLDDVRALDTPREQL